MEVEGESLHDSADNSVAEVKTEVQAPAQTEKPAKELSTREAIQDAVKQVKEKAKPEKTQAAPEAVKTETEAKPVVEKPKTIQPPQSWSAAAKAKFSGLDPILQKEILRREDDSHKAITKQDEDRNFGKQLRDVIQPYMPIITAEGGDPAKAVKQLLNTAYVLRTGTPQQKMQLIHQVARDYGVNLGGQPQPMNQELHSLQQQVQQLTQKLAEKETKEQQQAQTTVQQQIEAFAADPKNTHFHEVEAHMAALLQGGVAKDLQDAYDQAVWARPELRSTLLQSQQAEAEAKRKEAARAQVEAARKAGSSVSGAPGKIANAPPVDRPLRDELRANLRAALSST